MRTRLSKSERRSDILNKARRLILENGYATTEMEDIRLACKISRGGLYHHFKNKRAILDAIVDSEVAELVAIMESESLSPIPALIKAGSSHLGNSQGIVSGLISDDERIDYLSSLDQAFNARLIKPLGEQLEHHVQKGVEPWHVAELFVTINAHINRRELLGHWSTSDAADFATTALESLLPFLKNPSELTPIIADLRNRNSPS